MIDGHDQVTRDDYDHGIRAWSDEELHSPNIDDSQSLMQHLGRYRFHLGKLVSQVALGH